MIRVFPASDDSHLWCIESTRYSPALRTAAKESPGMIWDSEARCWVGRNDAVASCVDKLETQGIVVEGDPPSGWQENGNGIRVDKRYLEGLRDYQKAGVGFLVSQASQGALLAFDLGLGKTATTLRAIAAIDKPAVVICPSFVRGVWLRETKKWLPSKKLVELSTTKPKALEKADVYLIHYDIVYAWVEEIKKANVGIFAADEATFLMGENSRRSKACRELARHCQHRIAISGTPMTSRPKDLWNVVDTISEGRFGKPFSYFLHFCGAKKITISTAQGEKVVWDLKGSSNLEELRQRMNFFMLRRTKSDVAMQLPPRVRQIIEVEVERKSRSNIGDALKNDRQLRSALALSADGKLSKVVELVLSHVEAGSKVVVFSYRKAIAEAIAAQLKINGVQSARVITGDLDIKKRQAVIDEQPEVISATMDSTQVGIDLSFADVACFAELEYVPSKIVQCEGRVYRFGQKKNVLIQYIVGLATVDEVIRDILISKMETFEAGVGKTDDKLRQDLEGQKLSSVDQLRKLYEKILKQESKSP